MAMTLSSQSFSNIKRQIAQWESVSGRKASPEMVQSLMEAQLEVASAKALEEAKLGLSERQVALQEKSQADQLGLAQETLALNKLNAERNYGIAQTQLGMQQQQLEDQRSAAKTSGMIQLASTAIQGAMLLGGGGGNTLGSALGLASGGVGSATVSALGTAGLGSMFGGAVGGQTGSVIGGTVGGFAAGTAYGSAVGASIGGGMGEVALGAIGGPVGAVVGGVLGLVTGGGSVICTALAKEGLLTLADLNRSLLLRDELMSAKQYVGYRMLGQSILKHFDKEWVKKACLRGAKIWLSNKIGQKPNLSTKVGLGICYLSYYLWR